MTFATSATACVAGLASLFIAGAAQAQVAVSADFGTTGAGAYVIVPMERTISGRFGVHTHSRSKDQSAGAVGYDTKARLRTADILFDWFAFDNSAVRFTAGVVYNGNKLEAAGRPDASGNYTINNNSYTAADVGTLNGLIEFRRAAPYFGVGWGNPLADGKKKWHVVGEVGVFMQGPAKVKLVSLGCTTSLTLCKKLAADVAVEQGRFAQEIEFKRMYPVARVGMAYRF